MIGISEEARAIHGRALIVDLHCDLLLTSGLLGWDWGRAHRPNPLPGAALFGHCDIPRLQQGNLGCLALGLVSNPFAGPWRARHVEALFDRLDDKLGRHADAIELATTPQAIRSARARGKIACFAGLEGAHGLMGRVDDLERYKARGLGYVGLVHFTRNEACRPMVGWGAGSGRRRDEGLTDYGRDLVAELNRLGVLVDVAHANRAGLLEACARSTAPVICSHTACTRVQPSPRGLDDAQLKAIADTGGVIGVIFVTPFIGRGGARRVVEHLDHLKRVVGVDHCALGTDWEGFAVYPSDLDSAEKLPNLTQALLDAGWTPEEILKVYGENFLRVLGGVAG
ncbi:MAG: membrane dipeptidase [Alphaproteobacteria bacterium]|nr:membrane dipeptidase [Alphaproteobacteria bacterium]